MLFLVIFIIKWNWFSTQKHKTPCYLFILYVFDSEMTWRVSELHKGQEKEITNYPIFETFFWEWDLWKPTEATPTPSLHRLPLGTYLKGIQLLPFSINFVEIWLKLSLKTFLISIILLMEKSVLTEISETVNQYFCYRLVSWKFVRMDIPKFNCF